MDHFLPSDAELSQQVDVVTATTRSVFKVDKRGSGRFYEREFE